MLMMFVSLTQAQTYKARGSSKKVSVAQKHVTRRVSSSGSAVSTGSIYKIINQYSYCVDVQGRSNSNQANIHLWSYKNQPNQKWRFIDAGSGYYYIQSVQSNKNLDVKSGIFRNGRNVQQYSYNGSVPQKWKLVPAGNGYYFIRSKGGGWYLTFDGRANVNDTNICIYRKFEDASTQKWLIKKVY